MRGESAIRGAWGSGVSHLAANEEIGLGDAISGRALLEEELLGLDVHHLDHVRLGEVLEQILALEHGLRVEPLGHKEP